MRLSSYLRSLLLAAGICLVPLEAPCAEFPVDSLVDEARLEPQGERYTALVPDTLDLAWHASLAINCLTGNVEPTRAWSVYQVMNFGKEPELDKKGLTWNIPAKNVRALPYLRAMTGSSQGLHEEAGIMRALLENIHEDGCAYFPVQNDGAPKDSSYPYVNGLIAQAAWVWRERDGNPQWDAVIRSLAQGMSTIAIKVEDRAYYPPECGYKKGGEWLWTLRGESKIPYTPPAEPDLEQQGLEGCVKYEQAGSMRALALYLRDQADPAVLETLEGLTRFCLKPGMWEDSTEFGQPGNQQGIWAGHFHGTVTSLMALLDVAELTRDPQLAQLVRRGYEHAMRTGIESVGWVPGWLRPEAHFRPDSLYLRGEACGVADMVLLAVKLSDAGLGDYWDDVDAMARNHLIAQQNTDLDAMARFSGQKDNADLKRMVGSFGQGHPTYNDPVAYGCCSANGAMGLAYAWDGITRFNAGVAQVNLFLNRSAPWLDVDSYLPYEGKVVIHNKQAHTLQVRIPAWLNRTGLRLMVNGEVQQPVFLQNQLVITGLRPAEGDQRTSDEVVIEFPVENRSETYTLLGEPYRYDFRASTVYAAEPRTTDTTKVVYYDRANLNSDKAPMREVTRFVADRLPALY